MQGTIIEKKKVTDTVHLFRFELDGAFRYLPGHYVRLTLPSLHKDDPRGAARDFSIASSPDDTNSISIATRDSASGFKQTLLALSLGSIVDIDGPFGSFTMPQEPTPLVLIAGGMGITPFRSMVMCAAVHKLPHDIRLLFVNKAPEHAPFLDELHSLQNIMPNFKLEQYSHTADAVHAEKSQNALYYVAGAPRMVQEARRSLIARGIPEEHIRVDEFTGYDQ